MPGAIAHFSVAYGELTLTIGAGAADRDRALLRDDPAFLFVSFIDLTAVDYPVREKRFDVVTHLLSAET